MTEDMDDDDAALSRCFFCTTRPTHPDFWPYCGPECAIESEGDSVEDDDAGGWTESLGVALGAMLKPAWEALQKSKRSCWPKVKHPTYNHAVTHVRALINRGVQGDVTRLRIYECACGGFHVGHRKGRV